MPDTTPFLEVNEILNELLKNVRWILENKFVGMYLHGSLALGGFLLECSDIDFLVVTEEELPNDTISTIKRLHQRLYASGRKWAMKLEGAYMPAAALRSYDPDGPACPLVNGSEFLIARPGPDWVLNRYILSTGGIVLAGPALATLIDQVKPEDLKLAVVTLLGNNWRRFVFDATLFEGPGYQAFVVLTMCRALYTLERGTVPTKQTAGEWALGSLDEQWHGLIKGALDWRDGDPAGDIPATQDFMRYVFARAGLEDGLGS